MEDGSGDPSWEKVVDKEPRDVFPDIETAEVKIPPRTTWEREET